MTAVEPRVVVVSGATGLQGGAVARHLLREGWSVRALTRDPTRPSARALAALGAQVVAGDLEDIASLRPVVAGAYGVYSVQNPYLSGPEREVRQGINLAEVAQAEGIQHLVYGSAGTGQPGTGVPSWETKLRVEAHMQALGLPLTVLRPMAFMELLTERKFFPPVGAWQVMPQLMGASRPLGWLCTNDLGVIAARVFADPERFVGQELSLASDVQSLAECRALYREVLGRNPPRYPVPAGLFRWFGFPGQDLTRMWRWLRTNPLELDPGPTRALHPGALTMPEWLRTQSARGAASAEG
jgi:uncharacterized protein YbjT (DUF2867 family)